MIWCASLACLAGLIAGDVPDAVAARVRDHLARTWSVAPERVALEWGRVSSAVDIGDDAGFRVLGDGRSGRFVVALRSAAGEAAVSLRAGVRDSVWVAARNVSAGMRLAPEDVGRAERLRWGPPAGDGPAPIGWELRRNLAAGEILEPPSVAEPPLIEIGDEVKFHWERGGFRIVRTGVATSRARRGERVMARDPVRGDQLSGTTIGRGTARLDDTRHR